VNLLDPDSLERSAVVANSAMNRQRGLSGVNSYEKELGFNPVEVLTRAAEAHGAAAWLDLCCGQGKALIDAARHFDETNLSATIALDGVDLVHAFNPTPPGVLNIRLIAASLNRWTPDRPYDLITCVHGLHYIGDKLGLVEHAASWLTPTGVFAAHLDLANLRHADGTQFSRRLLADFRNFGLAYNRRRRILTCTGTKTLSFGYPFIGANQNAGPNFTRQDAVDSYYNVE
jgi:SAM-dependent methyltransferase